MERSLKNRGSYEHLMSALVKEFPDLGNEGKQKVFQFVATPMEANWLDAVDYNLFQLMDTVPAERNGFYVGSNSRVSNAYIDYLYSLASMDIRESDTYRRLQDQAETKYRMLQNEENNLKSVYIRETKKTLSAPEDMKMYRDWLETQSGLYAPLELENYLELRKEYKELKNKMRMEIEKRNRPLRKAIDAAEAEENKMRVTVKGENPLEMKVPQYTISGSLQEMIRSGDNRRKDDYCYKIEMNSEDVVEGRWKSEYGLNAFGGFLGLFAKGTTEMTQLLYDEKYKLTVQLKEAGTYNIQRGEWYQDHFVNSGKELDGGAMFKKEDFFGEKGSLQLIPASFFVVYRPKIQLTISRDVYKRKLHSSFVGNTILTIFGMAMGFAGSYRQELEGSEELVIDFENQEFTKPQIIGVTSMKKYM